ncbi:hypothetical protein [Dysosmobacter sp.]
MAIKLVTDDRIAETSSKGNQEKWREHGRWYKLDLFGYEGLAETVTSALLAGTNVEDLGFRYVTYRMEKLDVHRRVRLGCSSADFLEPGDAILTVADLLRKGIGPEWQSVVKKQPNLAAKVRWIAERVTELTGLKRFGAYLALLFEMDMLFCNEDRHLNNIAVLRRGESFDYCPIFDFGAGLLSNIRDYPMDVEPKGLLGQLRAKPMDCTFTRQVRAAQAIYGPQLRCNFAEKEIIAALEEPLTYYAQRDVPYLQDRVLCCITTQRKKLFD